MQTATMVKYGFRVRTRTGSVVDNLSIYGRDAEEAERKLRQMYHGCEILEARRQLASASSRVNASFEDVMNLITTG